MGQTIALDGVCFFWSETGTEGGYWAFQNKKHIHPPNKDNLFPRWDYEGLWVLKDGDYLTIYDKCNPNQIVWDGKIKLHNYPAFTESAHGMWIHSDQKGVNRITWSRWFLEEYPAQFTPDPNQTKNPA